MHGMKVNDSQYVHSTTLTLDISEVFFLLKRCTLEPVEKRWYFSDVIIIIYNINQTHHPPSDFFFLPPLSALIDPRVFFLFQPLAHSCSVSFLFISSSLTLPLGFVPVSRVFVCTAKCQVL